MPNVYDDEKFGRVAGDDSKLQRMTYAKDPGSFQGVAADDTELRRLTGISKAEENAIDEAENSRFNAWMKEEAEKLKERAIEEGKEFGEEEAKGFVKAKLKGDKYSFGESGYDNIVGKTARRFEKLIMPRKRGFMAGFGIFLGFAAASYIFFAIWQGPAQFIVFANYLRETHFYANHYILNNRLGKALVYAWTVDNPQNRNLSIIGNKFADHYDTKLKKAGITPEYDKSTRLKALTIDTTTPQGQRAIDQLKQAGIPEGELSPTNGAKTVRVELVRTDVSGNRFNLRNEVITGMIGTLDLNGVSGAMGARLLRVRAGVEFHPLKNMVRTADEKILAEYHKRVQDAQEQRVKVGVDPPSKTTLSDSPVEEGQTGGDKQYSEQVQDIADTAQGDGSIKERANTVRGKLTAGFGVTAIIGVVCGLDAIGDASVAMTYEQVNLPLERMGTEYTALGAQLQADSTDSNQDEIGYHDSMFYDEDTNTTMFDTDAVRINQGMKPLGFDLAKSAYPTLGEAPYFFNELSNTLDSIPVANDACGAMTSTVGGWALTIVGIGLTATGPVAVGLQVASEVIQDRIINVFLDDIIAILAGDQVDVGAKGAARGALIDTGSYLAANDARIAFGSNEMTKEESTQFAALMNKSKAIEQKNQSFYARYLDITNPNSFAAATVRSAPYPSFASYKNTLVSLPRTMASTLSSSFGTLFGLRSAFAEDTYDYTKIAPMYGFTVSELDDIKYNNPYDNEEKIVDQLAELNEKYGTPCFNTNIDPVTGVYIQTGTAKIAGEIPDECKDRSNEQLTRYRFYLADTLAAITAACYEGIQVEGRDFCAEIGFGGNQLANNKGTAAFRVGTFNVLGWEYTEPGPNGKKASWDSGQKRLVESFKLIDANGLDVVGLQEMQPEQHKKFDEDIKGTTWAMHPDPKKYSNYSSSNPIVWRTSEFDLLETGYQTNLQYFDGNQLDAPWVKLRHKATGEVIYFKNVHDPVGKSYANYRIANAKDHKADALDRLSTGEKVIFVGDFNSNLIVRPDYDGSMKRDNLTYCIITDGGQVQNAYDTSNSVSGHCPTKTNQGIDHIYHTTNVSMGGWTMDKTTERNELSDHPIVYADVLIGSTQGGSGGPGWEWPIKIEDWPKRDIPIAECDLRYTGPPVTVHTGMDISASYGTPVYAAADGVVSMRDDSWGAINIQTNETDSAGAKLYINYQHMSRTLVNKGDKVVKGQTVVGHVGSTGTGAVHLHFGIWRTNSFLGGHMTPTSPEGQKLLTQIVNPIDYMPKDGRNVKECN